MFFLSALYVFLLSYDIGKHFTNQHFSHMRRDVKDLKKCMLV